MAHSRFILSVQHKHFPAPIGVSVPSRTHEAPSPFKIARTTVYPKCCRRHVHLRQAGGCTILVQIVCPCGSNINNMCSGMFMCVFLWVRGHWLLSLNIYWQRVWGLRDIFINCPVQPDSRWNLYVGGQGHRVAGRNTVSVGVLTPDKEKASDLVFKTPCALHYGRNVGVGQHLFPPGATLKWLAKAGTNTHYTKLSS
jgi:hypothetical protein